MPDQDHQNQYKSGFYQDGSGGLLLIDRNGKTVKLDFDVDKLNLQKNKDSTIKNNIESESDMDLEESSEDTTDLTSEQLEENYWLETSKTKLDGSLAMMEKRISGLMEVTGRTHEECSKEVKARMKKAGSDNTNTTDTSDVKDEEEVEDEEEEEEKEKKEDTIEICSKEFDMLKEKAERLDTIEAELEEEKTSTANMKKEFGKMKIVFDAIQAKSKAELESKLQEKIKQFSTDFDVPKEKLQGKSLERIEEDMELISMIVKKNVEEEEPIEIDMDDLESDFMKRSKALDNLYKIKVVKP